MKYKGIYKEETMKKSVRLTALILAAVIGFASAAEPVMATEGDVVTEESTESTPEVTLTEEETTAEDAAEDSGAEKAAEEETTKAAKKKKKKAGNLDKYFGLDKRYWIIATAKKKTYVYKKGGNNRGKAIGKFTKNNCIVCNFTHATKGKNYKWIRVYMPNKSNKKGYILLKNVKLNIIDTKTFGLSTKSAKNRKRIKICQYGLPYMGTRFKMGGNSLTQGIDCSTFARRAFRNAGVMVPSDATAWRLSNCGKAIKRSQLKAGDMLFYPHNSHDRSIGHCAIYIGNGYIINASGHQGSKYPSGGIRISRIDYRSPSAVKFRNIVGN